MILACVLNQYGYSKFVALFSVFSSRALFFSCLFCRVLCMLVLHQVLLLTRQCIIYLIPDTPDFITQEIARTRLQQAHLQTRQRLLKHAQVLHATSLYQEDMRSTTDLPITSPQSEVKSSEGLYDTLRSTAGSAFHMPLQLAGTLRSTVLNATNSLTNNTHPTSTSTRQTDDEMRASTVPIPTITTAASPVMSPREYHLSRLLQQHTTSPYTFNPVSITLLTLLPALLHQLNISMWTYVPLAVLYFSYLQVAKDRNDKKLAIGIISDPNLIKFGKICIFLRCCELRLPIVKYVINAIIH